jgi:hypothetical protein
VHEKNPARFSAAQAGFTWLTLAFKKPISRKPEIGARVPSFNFSNPLIWGGSSSHIGEVTANLLGRSNLFGRASLRQSTLRPALGSVSALPFDDQAVSGT